MPATDDQLRRCAGISPVQYAKWKKDLSFDPTTDDAATTAAVVAIATARRQNTSLRPDIIAKTATTPSPV